jgi:hypothetical protein
MWIELVPISMTAIFGIECNLIKKLDGLARGIHITRGAETL